VGTAAVRASAPGKIILFGEHAVVYGEPSVSLALDRRIRVEAATTGSATTVNGEPLHEHHHAYIQQALRLHWPAGAIQLRTESDLPSAGGVGSSAALCVATVAALLRIARGRPPAPEDVARGAFETEFVTQGAASPNDTTVSTAGGAILLSPSPSGLGPRLWTIQRGDRVWNAHRLVVPRLPLVVAHSGVRARTADQVAKVRRFVDGSSSGRDVIREIGELTRDGVRALAAGDLARLGELMNRNHEALRTLGVDAPALARLVDAARRVPGTFGAKLTGAGGGGSIIALAERPEEVRRALERMGAHAFLAVPSARGMEVSA